MSYVTKILKEWEKFASTNAFKAVDSEAKNHIQFWARGKQLATIILEDTNLLGVKVL
jgi:hypothetical protein